MVELFNNTDFGNRPYDWYPLQILEIITEFKGGAPLTPRDFKKSGIKVLPKVGVIRGGNLYVEKDKQQYCSVEYANLHKSNLIDNNFTIVVLRDLVPSGPNIGLMVRITSTSKYLLAQGVYGFKVKENVSPDFLIHISNTDDYRKVMRNIMVGSTQVHITNSAFKKVQIPLPPTIEEQKAIATALNDTDELISKLEKLIAKKRAIKQGTMQELLKPKEGWAVREIREIFNLSATFSKSKYINSSGKYIVMDMGSVSSECKIINSKRTFYKEDILDVGDLVMPKDDIGGGNIIGKVAFIDKSDTYVLGDHVYRLRIIDKANNPLFFSYLINSAYINREFRKKASGSAQLGLGRNAVLEQDLAYPKDNTLRDNISQILSDMDSEIEALETKLEKYKLLKQGMMQNLLTGKIRLV